MKKIKFASAIALSSLFVAASALNVAAVDTTTEGSVNFKQQGDESVGEVILPGTEEEVIVPETGNHSKGPLRFTHVPDFDFSSLEIASETRFGNAILEKYVDKGRTEVKDISHFIQVEDVRGQGGGWKVMVSATKFTPKSALEPLAKSHIVLKQGKLFNTRLSEAEMAETVTGFESDMAITNDGQAVDVLRTVTGKTTDVSKTSLVFNNSYTKDTPAAGSVEVTTETGKKLMNPGAQLKAFGTDMKGKDETYTAIITWSLVDAI